MQIQGKLSQPQRESWQLPNVTGKPNFESGTGLVSSQDLLKLSDKIPQEGVPTFYHFQSPNVRPSGWRNALNAAQSVAMATALGGAGGVMLAVCTDVLHTATMGMVETMAAPVGGGLAVGLALGVAATAVGMWSEKNNYDREGEAVYGTLRGEFNQSGQKELGFYPYANNAERVNVNEFAQNGEGKDGSPWWLVAHKNRI